MAIQSIIMATMGIRILAIAEDPTIPTTTTITDTEPQTGTDHSGDKAHTPT